MNVFVAGGPPLSLYRALNPSLVPACESVKWVPFADTYSMLYVDPSFPPSW